MLWMIREPYSWLRCTLSQVGVSIDPLDVRQVGLLGLAASCRTSPAARVSIWLTNSQPAICISQRRMYSSSGMLNCSIRSGRSRLMNQGAYSVKCSLDSVTK